MSASQQVQVGRGSEECRFEVRQFVLVTCFTEDDYNVTVTQSQSPAQRL